MVIAEANFASGAEEASRTEERPGGCHANPAQSVIERGGETALIRCIMHGMICHKARRFTKEIWACDGVIEGGKRGPGLVSNDGEHTFWPPYDGEETVLPAELTARGNNDPGSCGLKNNSRVGDRSD